MSKTSAVPDRLGSLATVAGFAGLAWLVGLTLYLAGRPLDTGDLWWHLKLGELFSQVGPWLDEDPLVFTALPDSPRPHEWLFQVGLHGLARGLGLGGLRLVHAAAVAATLWLVFSMLRRAGDSALLACWGTGLFILLSWFRLFQLRPDLVSIPAAFLLIRWGVEGEQRPSWGRVAAIAVGMTLWANAHPLFAVGLALLLAALLGYALDAILTLRIDADDPARRSTRERATRVAVALGLGAAGALLNPRGIRQHLTFLHANEGGALWVIGDEWTAFDPFAWGHYVAGSVSLPMFVAADGVWVLFAVGAGAAFLRFWREPTRQHLEDFAPVRFGLALASIVAIVVSIRFFWLWLFPLLYIVHATRWLRVSRPASVRPVSLGAAISLLAVCIAYPTSAGFERDASRLAQYWTAPYVRQGYPLDAIRFLRDTGVEGRLFNQYGMGGFLGYWLAPRIKLFLDSRVESPPQTLTDYALINGQRSNRPGEIFLHVLERHGVDFFLGTGLPMAPGRVNKAQYTTSHLERAPGWILVFRTFDQALYIRLHRRNAENLRRIMAYYAALQVPFDLQHGLRVGEAIESNPQWAVGTGLVPRGFGRAVAVARTGGGARRRGSLEFAALALALAGDCKGALALDESLVAEWPRAPHALRRIVYCAMRVGQADRAVATARRLHALDETDARSAVFLERATAYAERVEVGREFDPARERHTNDLPLVVGRGTRDAIEARYRLAPWL